MNVDHLPWAEGRAVLRLAEEVKRQRRRAQGNIPGDLRQTASIEADMLERAIRLIEVPFND